MRHGLVPLICVGETLDERQSGQATAVLERQVWAAFARLSGDQRQAKILRAYEPVWAIGVNGIPATADYAEARCVEIAAVAIEVLRRSVPCVCGGSITPDNCAELICCPHIGGLFIGRSAWSVEGYLDVLACAS